MQQRLGNPIENWLATEIVYCVISLEVCFIRFFWSDIEYKLFPFFLYLQGTFTLVVEAWHDANQSNSRTTGKFFVNNFMVWIDLGRNFFYSLSNERQLKSLNCVDCYPAQGRNLQSTWMVIISLYIDNVYKSLNLSCWKNRKIKHFIANGRNLFITPRKYA